MDFSRRRVALACSYCRYRKRRCDAAKPACANCQEAGVTCTYDDGPTQRIDTSGGTREIIRRLTDIEAALDEQSGQLTDISSRITPQRENVYGPSPDDGTIGSSVSVSRPPLPELDSPWRLPSIDLVPNPALSEPMNIPVQHKTSSSHLLHLPSMRSLVGDYPLDIFFNLESRNPLPSELSFDGSAGPLPSLRVDLALTDHLVTSFFSFVHICHPVLEQETFERIYQSFRENGIDGSVESATCLVVFALGSVSGSRGGFSSAVGSLPGAQYMKPAIHILMGRSLWCFSYNPLIAQALLLASIYFAYIARPLHSWRLVYSASTMMQLKLSDLDSRRHALSTDESMLRLFWSCFMVECDRLAELELPRSMLQQLADDARLPMYSNLDSLHSTCLLAELSIRRLLNRIHNSLYPRRQDPSSQSPATLAAPDDFTHKDMPSVIAVCDELHRQLDSWHSSIPEPCRPPLGMEPLNDNRIAILRIRYYAARHIIYRPFVLFVANHTKTSLPGAIVDKARLCLESCRLYLQYTSHILKSPSQYTWTFSLSSLGATIMLTQAWLTDELRGFVPDIDDLQGLAVTNVRPWATSSISDVVSILEEIQRKTRLRSRV